MVFQDSDIHITFEDQQRINEFAKYNARFEDYKDELKSKEVDMFFSQNLFKYIKCMVCFLRPSKGVYIKKMRSRKIM